MQCGCPDCGRLMVQVQRGLQSTCICPECGVTCRACMGGTTVPLTRSAVQAMKPDEDDAENNAEYTGRERQPD
nr:hypothetical protein [bacterium]